MSDPDEGLEVPSRKEVAIVGPEATDRVRPGKTLHTLDPLFKPRSKTPLEAAQAAEAVGGPVVLKAQMRGSSHKTEVGGVIVGVQGRAAVLDACQTIIDRARNATGQGAPEALVIQEQVCGGKETIFGIVHDPVFGALLMFGLGGIYVEVLKDVAFGIVPVTDVQAGRLVRSIRAFPLLGGVRGEASVDLAMLENVAARLSQLVSDFPAILELDLNPFLALPAGGRSCAVDVRIRLAPGASVR